MLPPFDLDRIARETFAARVDYHESIASTNTRALELASDAGITLPQVVLTNQQLAGRGRGDNRWWSKAGALTFSIVMEHLPAIPLQKAPLLSLFTGLAVAEAIDLFLPRGLAKLKWPNDVYVEGKKLCGILVETTSRRKGAVVIGIGVNVNNSMHQAPELLRSTATSLADLLGVEVDRTDVLIAILGCLEKWLAGMEHAQQLAAMWRERCYLQGRTVQLELGPRQVRGVCEGINNEGALLVRTGDETERFFAGTISKIT